MAFASAARRLRLSSLRRSELTDERLLVDGARSRELLDATPLFGQRRLATSVASHVRVGSA